MNSKDKVEFYDLALLRLASPVTYNKYIQPVCVRPATLTFQRQPRCWVTGWGVLREDLSEIGNGGRGTAVRYPCPFFQPQQAPKPFCGLWSSESLLPSCSPPTPTASHGVPTCVGVPSILEQVWASGQITQERDSQACVPHPEWVPPAF